MSGALGDGPRPPAPGRSTLLRLWAHLGWAARTLQERLDARAADGEDPVEEALRLYAHLVFSERVWLDRIAAAGSAHPIWPTEDDLPSREVLRSLQEDTLAEGRTLLEDPDFDPERRVTYRNSSGLRFETSLGDILLHLALHGAYHRGQVARALRAAGAEPVNTDYITWVRERG